MARKQFQVIAKSTAGDDVKIGPTASHLGATNLILAASVDAEIVEVETGTVFTRVTFDPETSRPTFDILVPAPAEPESEFFAMGPKTGKSHHKRVNW